MTGKVVGDYHPQAMAKKRRQNTNHQVPSEVEGSRNTVPEQSRASESSAEDSRSEADAGGSHDASLAAPKHASESQAEKETAEAAAPASPPPVTPNGWLRAIVSCLKTTEPELWQWFSANRIRNSDVRERRIELLRSAYRLDRETTRDLYSLADHLVSLMDLAHITEPVTLYQAQQSSGLNVSIPDFPNELHVILHGPVLETLDEQELTAILAHEFAHHELHRVNDHACQIAEQLLTGMANDSAASPVHERTLRNFRLHTELSCDRRAAQVTDNPDACIRALMKMETG
ncbi:MAG: M48 family metalloprotease, partial [Planctomycetaceae bacterium]|nr:M48 family metalloprotease [Planctomycetaceae bacterium]